MAQKQSPPTGGLRAPRYALGMILMLVDAIQRHRDAHHGARPSMICMHPNLRHALLNEQDAAYGPLRVDITQFEGVPITWQRRAIYPYVVSSTGMLYFL